MKIRSTIIALIIFASYCQAQKSQNNQASIGSFRAEEVLQITSPYHLLVDEDNPTQSEESIAIGELFANKSTYSNKKIIVSGKVVKFNGGIMGKNWIHIQDGTEHDGENDLTVTTDMTAKVGDSITVEGVIILDKDFGAGYFYKIIMEEAKIIE